MTYKGHQLYHTPAGQWVVPHFMDGTGQNIQFGSRLDAQRAIDVKESRSNGNVSYDYKKQAWVVNGKYISCVHPATMECDCYGKEHAGEEADV